MKPTSSVRTPRTQRSPRLLGKGRELQSSVLACAQAPTRSAPPTESGLRQARRMVGGIPGAGSAARVDRLAGQLDKLGSLLRKSEKAAPLPKKRTSRENG